MHQPAPRKQAASKENEKCVLAILCNRTHCANRSACRGSRLSGGLTSHVSTRDLSCRSVTTVGGGPQNPCRLAVCRASSTRSGVAIRPFNITHPRLFHLHPDELGRGRGNLEIHNDNTVIPQYVVRNSVGRGAPPWRDSLHDAAFQVPEGPACTNQKPTLPKPRSDRSSLRPPGHYWGWGNGQSAIFGCSVSGSGPVVG